MPVVQTRRTRSSKHRAIRNAVVEALESRGLLAATIYVDQFAFGATADGTTWDTAFLNLRDAITAAQSGDTIESASGTYLPSDGTTQPPASITRPALASARARRARSKPGWRRRAASVAALKCGMVRVTVRPRVTAGRRSTIWCRRSS